MLHLTTRSQASKLPIQRAQPHHVATLVELPHPRLPVLDREREREKGDEKKSKENREKIRAKESRQKNGNWRVQTLFFLFLFLFTWKAKKRTRKGDMGAALMLRATTAT